MGCKCKMKHKGIKSVLKQEARGTADGSSRLTPSVIAEASFLKPVAVGESAVAKY